MGKTAAPVAAYNSDSSESEEDSGDGGGAGGGKGGVVSFLDDDAGGSGDSGADDDSEGGVEEEGGGGGGAGGGDDSDDASDAEEQFEELRRNRLPAPGGKLPAPQRTNGAGAAKRLKVGSRGGLDALDPTLSREYFGGGGSSSEEDSGDEARGEDGEARARRLAKRPAPRAGGGGDEGEKGAAFAALGLAPALCAHLSSSLGFERPTRVQRGGIPVLLRGRDALVQAATGSGKTLTYLAPIVHDLQGAAPRISRGDGTYALVLAPTRELCVQINEVLQQLLRRYVWIVGGVVYGGENRAHEKARLRKGISVLVATPGRLLDHLKMTACFGVSRLKWLVLDEADRLLDLGFEEALSDILRRIEERRAPGGARRQTALCSATLGDGIGRLAGASLEDPAPVGFTGKIEDGSIVVEGGEDGEEAPDPGKFTLPSQLRQTYALVPAKMRLVALLGLLRGRAARDPRGSKAVVFVSSCDGCEFAHRAMQGLALDAEGEPLVPGPAYKLHGNMEQSERTAAFLSFSEAARGVLVCTDVAARGLDFPAVSTIVQFDPPGEPAEYVHRVGRTARMGKEGESVLFLLPSEREYIGLLSGRGVEVAARPCASMLDELPGEGGGAGGGKGRRPKPGQHFGGEGDDGGGDALGGAEYHEDAVATALRVERAVAASKGGKLLAQDAFRSYVRAMAAHPKAIKHIFHVKRLHLGHVARSFALRDPPTMIGRSSSKQNKMAKMKLKKGGVGGSGKLRGLERHGAKAGVRIKGSEQKRMLTKARQLERAQHAVVKSTHAAGGGHASGARGARGSKAGTYHNE